jgi:hypothetical protein
MIIDEEYAGRGVVNSRYREIAQCIQLHPTASSGHLPVGFISPETQKFAAIRG